MVDLAGFECLNSTNIIEDEGSAIKKKKDEANKISVKQFYNKLDWEQTANSITIKIALSQSNDCNQNKDRIEALIEEDKLQIMYAGIKQVELHLLHKVDRVENIEHADNGLYVIHLKKVNQILWASLQRLNEEIQNENIIGEDMKAEKEIIENEKNVIVLENPKTDLIELAQRNNTRVYLYVSGIDEQSTSIDYQKDNFCATFSSSDEKFLASHNATSKTIFQWNPTLKGEIHPKQCSFKLTSKTLEILLMRVSAEAWGGLSPVTPIQENKSILNDQAKEECSPEESNIPKPPPLPESNIKRSSEVVSYNRPSHRSFYSYRQYGEKVSIGYTGLDNLGNTCFMNSVLQCLINTNELRQYFLSGMYKQDLNQDNPLGMGGKLAATFGELIKYCWTGERCFSPSSLKTVMGLKANQFCGWSQHDAQEFMVELLDGLHEDLNRIKKKPYTAEPPDLENFKEDDAAEESWRLHKQRNDSIIDDLFKGQFKSTLVCHTCKKKSLKFDEFCCLSVPIPKDLKRVNVVFFWRDTKRNPRKITVRVPSDCATDEFIQQISKKTNVRPDCIKMMEVCESKIHRKFNKCTILVNAYHNSLLAFEVLSESVVKETVWTLTVSQKKAPEELAECVNGVNCTRFKCKDCSKAVYCTSCKDNDSHGHKNYCKRGSVLVGCPFYISVTEREATYSNLYQMMENYSRFSVNTFQPPVNQFQRKRRNSGSDGEMNSETEEMETDSDGGSAACNRLSNSFSDEESLTASPVMNVNKRQPLFTIKALGGNNSTTSVQSEEQIADKGSEPIDLSNYSSLNMEWNSNESTGYSTCLIKDKDLDFEVILDDEPDDSRREVTLESCIDLFTRPEKLCEGDSWRCPRCKKPVEANKQMSIWRLPPILIVQLKRFSFKFVVYADKIDRFIKYPLRGLNLAPFMSKEPTDGGTLYDLYGVINHYGRLLGGHYTSFCRTPNTDNTSSSNIDWRRCDDTRVSNISESEIVHDHAYILIYRRRDYPVNVERPILHSESEVQEMKNLCLNRIDCLDNYACAKK